MGPGGSNCRFRNGSPGQRPAAAIWVLAAGAALLFASCTAAGPTAKNSTVPPSANVLALAGDKQPAGDGQPAGGGQPAGDKPAAGAIQPAAAAGSPFHDETIPPKKGEPLAKPASAAAGQAPPVTVPVQGATPVPVASPSPKPAAAVVAPAKPSGVPPSPAKATLLPAAAQLPAEPAPVNLPALAVPASGAGAEQAIACVLQYATQHHPLLRVRQYEVEAARARIVTARLLPNPELMVEAVDSNATSGPPELDYAADVHLAHRSEARAADRGGGVRRLPGAIGHEPRYETRPDRGHRRRGASAVLAGALRAVWPAGRAGQPGGSDSTTAFQHRGRALPQRRSYGVVGQPAGVDASEHGHPTGPGQGAAGTGRGGHRRHAAGGGPANWPSSPSRSPPWT